MSEPTTDAGKRLLDDFWPVGYDGLLRGKVYNRKDAAKRLADVEQQALDAYIADKAGQLRKP
jgi:hypothetical protein